MTQEQVAELKKVVYNSLDFCGKPMEAAQSFCKENGIAWDYNSQYLAVTFIEMYPK